MRHHGATWILSPTDLSEFLACEHLTGEKVRHANGERGDWPKSDSAHTAIVQRRGDENEEIQLRRLEAEAGEPAVDLTPADGEWPKNVEQMRAATGQTLDAMKVGHALITQAVMFDEADAWFGSGDANAEPDDGSDGAAHRFGLVDVLRRVEIPSPALGDWSYEVVEIKLARQPKPKFVHQVSVYSRVLGKLQGVEPELGWLLLGDGSEHEVQLSRFGAVHSHVEGKLRGFVAEPPSLAAVPEPVEHCQLCSLAGECHGLRVAADHLSLVANLRSNMRKTLEGSGIETLAALAKAEGDAPTDMTPDIWNKARVQAGLQLNSRETGEPCHRNIEPQEGLGYARLPQPDPADLFFDLEGDPYEGPEGIEFLWGWTDAKDTYDCAWARDEASEKAALEKFIDFASERWQQNPGMHVYHYAPHEYSKLKSLAQKYATREQKLDELLRGGVIVDLYGIVRQSLQVGEEGYSLKQLERHHGFERKEKSVRGGGGAIVAYETYLAMKDDPEAEAQLEAIREYNEEDCVSTRSLRDWMWNITFPEAREQWPDADFSRPPEKSPEEATEPDLFARSVELAEQLRGSAENGGLAADEAAMRMLLSNLMLYHRREDKVYWWRFFELDALTSEELVAELDAIGGLVRDHAVPPWDVTKQSHAFEFTVPAQNSKIRGAYGKAVLDHPGEEAKGSVHSIELKAAAQGRVVMTKSHGGGVVEVPPNPRGIVDGYVKTEPLWRALIEVAEDVLSGNESFGTALSLLRKDRPAAADGSLLELTPASLIDDVLRLGNTVMPVQGPPGTGKTHNGAAMIVAALKAGKRVGVTAPNHKAIMNLLTAVEEQTAQQGGQLKGGYAVSSSSPDEWQSPHGFVTPVKSAAKKKLFAPDMDLIAGTAWLFSSRGEDKDATASVDLLFVDEAGQYPLANAVAASTATRGGLVLLGDPQQLPQVTQGTHPDGAGCSVLEHLFEDQDTVEDGAGVLLNETWRLHPDICEFNSWLSYDEKLHSRDDCSTRAINSTGRLTGAGLRFVPLDHEGCEQGSPEEAEVIAALCRELLDSGAIVQGPIGDSRAFMERALLAEDIKVVAPYNVAVQMIQQAVPTGVSVGTVDKFQGQEAPVVFYAMTSSTAQDAPRGMAFLFDDHRLNVAVSRAQCLAVVVASPRLLDAPARSLEQLELVNALCDFVERAAAVDPSA